MRSLQWEFALTTKQNQGGKFMKGYNTPEGFMGLVKGKYQLFASETEYYEYMLENKEV